jgi:hypothetical protein
MASISEIYRSTAVASTASTSEPWSLLSFTAKHLLKFGDELIVSSAKTTSPPDNPNVWYYNNVRTGIYMTAQIYKTAGACGERLYGRHFRRIAASQHRRCEYV